MKLTVQDPPREFTPCPAIRIKDCAKIELDANEQVTFVTPAGAEYDVARTAWGFYATPSLNGRLAKFGLRALLVKSLAEKYYLLLVEEGKEVDLQRYLDVEGHVIVCWLDKEESLAAIENSLMKQPNKQQTRHDHLPA